MAKELLAIAEVVANERDVSRETIFEALEAALAAATRKRSEDEGFEAQVNIDRKTGDYETFRVWHIVDDEDILENPQAQMREAVAQIEFPDANLRAGDRHLVAIENVEFGRISAQQAKQIIIQKLREAEREKVYQQFIDKEGTLIYGTVRRHDKGNVILDIGGVEATILRSDLIARENLRVGERVQGYLAKVNREMRGPQLQVSRVAPEFLIQLFQKEVPEISAGNIEIMGAARDPGLRAKIAVRAFDPRIDPVGACVGIRGSRVQGVMNELSGERIDIVAWDEDMDTYVRKAMSPAVISDLMLDYAHKTAYLSVAEDKLAQAVGRGGQNVRLASELTGWTIEVLSESDFAQKMQSKQEGIAKTLAQKLTIELALAKKLVAIGMTSPEDIVYGEREEILSVLDNDEDSCNEVVERATDFLLHQAFTVDDEDENEAADALLIEDLEGLNEAHIQALKANDIHTQEDLAELASDELEAMIGVDNKTASALILKAREPWFR